MKTGDTRNTALHRLKIARGHLDKVIRMMEAGEYCIDILTQSQAVQAQLRETDVMVLQKHLKTCVVDALRSGEKDDAVDEVIKVWRRSA